MRQEMQAWLAPPTRHPHINGSQQDLLRLHQAGDHGDDVDVFRQFYRHIGSHLVNGTFAHAIGHTDAVDDATGAVGIQDQTTMLHERHRQTCRIVVRTHPDLEDLIKEPHGCLPKRLTQQLLTSGVLQSTECVVDENVNTTVLSGKLPKEEIQICVLNAVDDPCVATVTYGNTRLVQRLSSSTRDVNSCSSLRQTHGYSSPEAATAASDHSDTSTQVRCQVA
mmetsp:Transcript_9155/g.25574  ORF Transcript_9155/g.25574 Transcript_9155/m.25574 type:complete len:222 (-) Transcript_9155:133-798(-)